MSTIEENNKLRIQQLGEVRASEMTKREQMALSILEGLLSNYDYKGLEEFYVDEAISLADILIEKLNKNI
jgi:hypothetical protein